MRSFAAALVRKTAVVAACVVGFAPAVTAGDGPNGPRSGAQPAPKPGGSDPKAKKPDWSAHMGDVKFVVGFEEGMEQAWTEGRPAMLFFTSAKDKWCPIFAKRTWTNKPVLEKLAAYLPILVDADDEAGKKLVKTYGILVLPSVIWVTSEGDQVFMAQGDLPLDIFDTAADVAKARAPEVKKPEILEFIERVRADYRKASEAKDVRKMIYAATALVAIKRPKGVAEEGQKILDDLDAQGRARLDAARKGLAEGKASAKAELEALASEYRGRDVGREAAAALPQEPGGEK